MSLLGVVGWTRDAGAQRGGWDPARPSEHAPTLPLALSGPAGTDGLWDNAYESEIIDCTKGPDVKQSAEQLAALARRHASDNDFASPYSREALSQGLDLPWWEKVSGAL